MNIDTLFETAVERKASDIHLATGEIPCLRISGELVRMEAERLDREAFHELLNPIFSPESRARFGAGQEVDFNVVRGEHAFSVCAFRSADEDYAATIRIIATGVPSLDVIGIGGMRLFYDRLLEVRRGLVLVTGPTMSGKWTSACALIGAINERRADRIFVIENRTSYRFESKKSLVTQFQVGSQYENYERAIGILLHADLDVAAVDNIPTAEALRELLILAETGHLIFATLHAESVPDAVERLLVAAGPDVDALRRSLSKNLVALSVQRLVPRVDEPGRVAAYEWITGTPAVREALLAGSLDHLHDLQQTDPECRSLDAALDELVRDGYISEESAAKTRFDAH